MFAAWSAGCRLANIDEAEPFDDYFEGRVMTFEEIFITALALSK